MEFISRCNIKLITPFQKEERSLDYIDLSQISIKRANRKCMRGKYRNTGTRDAPHLNVITAKAFETAFPSRSVSGRMVFSSFSGLILTSGE